MGFLDCFSISGISRQPDSQGSQRVGLEFEPCRLPPSQQTLNDIQAALLSLEGSWPKRAEGLVRVLGGHGLVVKVYGLTRHYGLELGDWVVLMPDTTSNAANCGADWSKVDRARVLQYLSNLQAPGGAQLLCSSCSVSDARQGPTHQPQTRHGGSHAAPAGAMALTTPSAALNAAAAAAAAAVPLIRCDQLVGAIWLESREPPPPLEPPKQTRRAPSVATSHTAAASAGSALLRSPESLRQLSFAASLCLAGAGGSDTLSWLSDTVSRLRSAPSMQSLTAQLCACLAAHVRSRFVLEAAVSAALVPPPPAPPPPPQQPTATPMSTTQQQQSSGGTLSAMLAASVQGASPSPAAATATTALLFKSVGGVQPPHGISSVAAAGEAAAQSGGGGGLDSEGHALATPAGSMRERRKLSSSQSQGQTRDGFGVPTMAPRVAALGRPSQAADDGPGSSSYGPPWAHGGAGHSNYAAAGAGSALRSSLSTTEHPLVGEGMASSGPATTMGIIGGVTGAGAGTGTGLGRSLGRSVGHTAIVALSREDVAAATASTAPHAAAAVLHVEAFPLRGSLLQTVLGAASATAEPPPPQPEQRRTLTPPPAAGGRPSASSFVVPASPPASPPPPPAAPHRHHQPAPPDEPRPAAFFSSRRGSTLTASVVGMVPLSAGVIEDTHLYLQDAANPSRDVCLIMGLHKPTGTGPSPGPAGAGAGALSAMDAPRTGGEERNSYTFPAASSRNIAISNIAAAAAASVGTPLAPSPLLGAPQSLVLLGMQLGGGAALGLYLCFPKRLPGPLLEAVRGSCQELMDKVLGDPVRSQLAGALAPEYDTLIHATPGSYAVVRGLNFPADGDFDGDGNDGGDGDGSDDGREASGRQPPADERPSLLSGAVVAAGSGSSGLAAAAAAVAAAVAAGGSGTSMMGSTSRERETVSRSPEIGEPPLLSTAARYNPMEDARKRLSNMLRSTSARNRAHPLALPALNQLANRAASITTSPAAASPSAGAGAGRGLSGVLSGGGGAVGAGVAGYNRSRSFLEAFVTTRDFSITAAGGEVGSGLGGYPMTDLLATADGGGGGGRTASFILVSGAEAGAEQARRRMDLLVSSIQATIQASTAAGTSARAFSGDLDQLELVEVLGRGGGGVVLRGLMSGSLPVAVKLVELQDEDAEQLDEHGMRVRRGMLRNAMELAVQSSLSHPNIVQFYGTFSNVVLRNRDVNSSSSNETRALDPSTLYLQVLQPDSTERAPACEDCSNVTCILAEFCDQGSLADALGSGLFPVRTLLPPATTTAAAVMARHRGSAVPTSFAYDMKGVYMTLLDVALALRHLHCLNLVHRDVKPANLLLKSNPLDPRGFTVKLADFGFVLQLTEAEEDGSFYACVETPCGTLTHIAPECLQKNARVDSSADIYSFGILMWELLAGGTRPFSNVALERIPRVVRAGARPPFVENVPQGYRVLAHQCWRTDPRRRPRAADLVTAIGALLSSLK